MDAALQALGNKFLGLFSEPVANMILAFVVGVAGGLTLYKYINKAYINSLGVQKELLDRQQAELDSKIKALPEPRQLQMTLENQRILDLAKEDRERIDSAIRVYGCAVKWNPNKNSDQVFFELKVFNGSSYSIYFDKVEGRIAYNGEQLWGETSFYTVNRPLSRLEPRGAATIGIAQPLQESVAQKIRQDFEKKSFPYFDLRALRIMIVDGDGSSRITPQPLAFNGFRAINLQGRLK